MNFGHVMDAHKYSSLKGCCLENVMALVRKKTRYRKLNSGFNLFVLVCFLRQGVALAALDSVDQASLKLQDSPASASSAGIKGMCCQASFQ